MRSTISLRWGAVLVLVMLSGLVAACGVPSQAEQPGRAQIDEVRIQILESFPVQVEVLIKGKSWWSADFVQVSGELSGSAINSVVVTVQYAMQSGWDSTFLMEARTSSPSPLGSIALPVKPRIENVPEFPCHKLLWVNV